MSTYVETVPFPLFTSTNHRINLAFYSDGKRKTAKSISGKTIRFVMSDPSGATYSYAATAISATLGTAYITLTGSQHTTAGTATVQVTVDGIPKQEFSIPVKAKL